ncbi:pyrophosphatase [Tanacetum coccineum]
MFVGFIFSAMYCVAVAALEMLGTGMAIDAYGPICDNAGCIAEMAAMSHRIRERTDVVDAAGKTRASNGIEESMEQLMSTKARHGRVIIRQVF